MVVFVDKDDERKALELLGNDAVKVGQVVNGNKEIKINL